MQQEPFLCWTVNMKNELLETKVNFYQAWHIHTWPNASNNAQEFGLIVCLYVLFLKEK